MGLLNIALGLAVLGLLLGGFYRMTRVSPGSDDLEFLQRHNLYALHVFRIVESADYQFYARKNREYRDFLFDSYARNLETDVVEIGEITGGWLPIIFRYLFRGVYAGLRLKRRFKSSISDLRLLLGIVLALVGRLSRRAA